MRRFVKTSGLAVALVAFTLTAGIQMGAAVAAPGQVNVQGALRDATGALMEGDLTVSLRIYAGQVGGTALWEETRTVAVSNGLFSALMPADPVGNAFPAMLFGTGVKRWLGVQPQGQGELPRTPLVSVPFALHAETAGLAARLSCSNCVTATMIDPDVFDAALIDYDGTSAGLAATTVQDAVDELAGQDAALQASIDVLGATAFSGAFGDLTGVPAGLADGDDDLLAGMSCATGQVVKRTAGGWVCGDDIDTKLVEAQVDAFVSNNGYALASGLATIASTAAWSDLVGVPAALLDGDQDVLGGLACADGRIAKRVGGAWACADDIDTQLTEAQVDAHVSDNGYALAASLSAVATGGRFSDLTAVPVGLADGDDDLLAGISCAAGNVLKFVGGSWQCATDTDTKLTEAQVDAFVSDNGYATSSSLAAIATSGAWGDLGGVPADIADGDADTLGALVCPNGQIVKRESGLWKCGLDADTKLTEAQVDAYVSDNGYALAGDLSVVGRTGRFSDLLSIPAGLADGDQDTLGGLSCASGQIAKRVGSAWQCGTDIDTDTRLSEAQVDAYVSNNGYAAASSLAQVATTGQFAHLSGIPSGIADGDADTLGGMTCSTGQVAKWSGSAWQCGDDSVGGGGSGGGGDSARSYYVVLALRSNTYCPAGYTRESVSTMAGSNGYIYTMINEAGLYIGGSNSPSYGQHQIYGRFHTSHGISTVCWKKFTSSSGYPHTSVMTIKGGNASSCPSGYHYIPISQTKGNNGWGYMQANDSGIYMGFIDSWSHASHSYEDDSGYQQWHWTSHVDTLCYRVYGVDEDPATAAGVYPVFLGVRNTNECPSGWERRTTSSIDRSDGWFYIMGNPNASFFGGHYSWGHGGNSGQYIQYHQSYVKNTCWKYFVRDSGVKPSSVVKVPRSGACPSGYWSFGASNLKGWNNNAYMQATSSMLYLGGLYTWSVWDYSDGYVRNNWTSLLTNRLCLKMNDVQ